MKRYLNWYGETIDELDSEDFAGMREFYAEKKRLAHEYALAGMAGKWSQRMCNNWRDK